MLGHGLAIISIYIKKVCFHFETHIYIDIFENVFSESGVDLFWGAKFPSSVTVTFHWRNKSPISSVSYKSRLAFLLEVSLEPWVGFAVLLSCLMF